ncbi:protein kinase domain-containing protein [Streptomyces litchfieldiae]|uniref:non-specific serine/threonine protein kinase n=1 Tax=Streptomyces litchfieldiae TaxID=3075543 RepID=A0ABU2MVC7_9ACTN|nr:PQQ-binding-like beta-propeller repeat protein [Streptomyces sp. DSM 44938]MDT0344499.1 protein kinase [Streptomyces sp. DSM 44938]
MEDRKLADRYRLVRPLGQGGMGEVWEAHDESLRRPVAVKVISALAGGGSRADEARARFLREARITAVLQHPHIVTVHDLGEAATDEGTTPFLVMELLQARGLDAVIRRGPAGEADAARWGAQICDALAEARGRPEQRSDLYALGCLLFELLTGQLPFTAPDTVGYLTAHLNDTPPAPSSVAPGVSAAWDNLVLRLLAKDPGQRYDSAAALADELRRLDGLDRTAARYTPTVADPGEQRPAPPPATARGNSSPAPTSAATTQTAPRPAGRPGATRRDLLCCAARAPPRSRWPAALYLTGAPRKDPVAWSRNIGDVDLMNSSGSDVIVADGRCHVARGNDYRDDAVLCTVDLAGGEPLWEAPLNGLWASGERHFTVIDGTVLAMTRHRDEFDLLHAFDAAGGERRWQREIALGTQLDVHRPSGLLITGEDRLVVGIDPRTGDSRWTFDASPYGGFVPAGDLVLCDGGWAVHGETGEELWERSDIFPRGDRGQALGEGILC